MAITMTMVVPGGTKELYEDINAELGIDSSNLPDGLIAHYASITPEGVRIFDVWESEAAWNTFEQERLGPAVSKLSGGMASTGGELGQLHNSFKA
jgi:hypothetical protein